jgi:hypothetical protein
MVTATTTADGPAPGAVPSSKEGHSKPASGTNTPGATTPMQYSYMFEEDKRLTQQCDALLRAIARHIVSIEPFLSDILCCVTDIGSKG